MNPNLSSQTTFPEWEPNAQAIFYEPRTIPLQWDLSEYLPEFPPASAEEQPQEDQPSL